MLGFWILWKLLPLHFYLPNQSVFSMVSWQVDWCWKCYCLLRRIENSPVWVCFSWVLVKVSQTATICSGIQAAIFMLTCLNAHGRSLIFLANKVQNVVLQWFGMFRWTATTVDKFNNFLTAHYFLSISRKLKLRKCLLCNFATMTKIKWENLI